ncbi:hypothetical protein, partial [Sulfitobacter pontiacus]|uniref:hypothetical protein n=1 Tax=Sulfitobacter pontiacus TaxID=60137 RepID=UPI0032661A6B
HRGVVRERLLLWGGGVNWILATKWNGVKINPENRGLVRWDGLSRRSLPELLLVPEGGWMYL